MVNGYCLAFPFEACGGVHDCVLFEFLKKVGGKPRFPPTMIGYSVNEPDGGVSVKFNEFVLMFPVSAYG